MCHCDLKYVTTHIFSRISFKIASKYIENNSFLGKLFEIFFIVCENTKLAPYKTAEMIKK